MPPLVPGLRAVAASFDVFLVDVYGVIHDGERPFASVAHALEQLAARGRVVFVTNTSRTSDVVARSLVAMGIARALFHDVITAGDVTRAALASRDPAVFGALPGRARCFHFGDPGFVPWLFELGLDFTDDAGACDLVVVSGAARDDDGLAAARATLAPAIARGVPFVCTNPDRLIPTSRGPRLGPGAVARVVAELGARVFLYGKPHAPIFAEARRRLGGIDDRRVLVVGDTVETDIRGAAGAGWASALVVDTGVHAAEDLAALFAREGASPDLLLARFAW